MYYTYGLSFARHPYKLEPIGDQDFLGVVREYLATCDLTDCNRGQVALRLRMSESSLRRRLASRGAKFSDLLESERMIRCQKLLHKHGPRAYGKVLAHELGYREVNSFTRAFRKWFGVRFLDVRIGVLPIPEVEGSTG